MPSPPLSVAVVGGGVSGLAAAFRLIEAGVPVTLFEGSARAGGSVLTARGGGFIADLGPTSAAETPALAGLVRALGLEAERVRVDPALRTRYVARGGRPLALPLSPPALFGGPFFSARGKLRVLAEPLVRRRSPGGPDETVAAFARRRLGPEVLAYGLDPFLGGVFAGSPEGLSVRHALPALYALEETYGSVLRGLWRKRREGAPGPGPSVSFRRGMQTLTDRLAEALGPRLRLGAEVSGLRRGPDGWHLALGAEGEAGPFGSVVLALPPGPLAALLPGGPGPLAEVASPPVAVVALGYRRRDVRHALDGLGVLVPSASAEGGGGGLLGALFTSSMFPFRAPEGHVLLTAFVGGTRRPEAARARAASRLAAAHAALEPLLGLGGEPVWARQALWPRAIPQYAPGYDRVLEALAAAEAAHPGLHVAGTTRGGIALGAAVASGEAAARAVLG